MYGEKYQYQEVPKGQPKKKVGEGEEGDEGEVEDDGREEEREEEEEGIVRKF
jgi:hypothetical protein